MNIFRQIDRTAILIDSANHASASQGSDIRWDYGKLRSWFLERTNLVRCYYFTGIPADPRDEFPMQKLLDWLSYNGYILVTKPIKTYRQEDGSTRMKSNLDIEIAVHALLMAPNVDHFIFFSGDGDFTFLVKTLQQQGKKVTAISSTMTRPTYMSQELRKQVDNFVELDDLANVTGAVLPERVSLAAN